VPEVLEMSVYIPKRRRHRFVTYDGAEPAIWPNREIDLFQFGVGHRNGPRCVDCGATRCHHCDTGFTQEECPAKKGA
jgi:hypothetical protein